MSDGAGNLWGTSYTGGVYSYGTVFKVNLSTGAITKVADFANSTTGDDRGGGPSAPLVSDGAGNFWGTTVFGGAYGYGTVFKVDVSTGAITTVVDFDGPESDDYRGAWPMGSLVMDGSGNLWGTTSNSGNGGCGTVFEVNASTGVMTTVVDFANNTTDDNRGGNPMAGLVSDGAGNFWGTTQQGGANFAGTVFEVNASTGAVTTIVDFLDSSFGDNRGAHPLAGLVSDGSGNLWGTTSASGSGGFGTAFAVNVTTGAIVTYVDFNRWLTTGNSRGGAPQADLVDDGTGNLWGTTSIGSTYDGGTIFKIDVSTGAITTVADLNPALTGSGSQGALVSDGSGNFWGTARQGAFGATENGTIFKINTGTLAVTAIDLVSMGTSPQAGLVSDSAGNLWGVASSGGAYNWGTVYKVDPNTGVITTVVDFAGTTTGGNRGGTPVTELVSDGAGNFWGTTSNGGASQVGTVFKVNASTGAITTVVDFTVATTGSSRGNHPAGALVSDGAGNFWGTTGNGGAHFNGTVFEIDISTGAITTVLDFARTTTGDNRGGNPFAGLVSDGAGSFWGTTYSGGASSSGTIFKVNASTGVITTVVDFTGGTTGNGRGGNPFARLASDGSGNLWGTTCASGAAGNGTVFKVNISTGAITTVVDFTGGTTGNGRGGTPIAPLVSDGSGNLWGTTNRSGANGGGTVFEVNASTGAITTVFDLDSGALPRGSLLATTAGLYGTTYGAGTGGAGSIFLVGSDPQFAAPSVSGITSSGATVSGSANPEGIATSVYVEYGADTSYGTQTSSTSLGNGTSSVPFSIGLSGLYSGTTYHYRLVFVTPYGNFYSADQTFASSLSTPSPVYIPVYNFQNPGLGNFSAEMVSDGAGNLWGTTSSGGGSGYGTVFKINVSTAEITTVVNFFTGDFTSSNRGQSPLSAVVSDGAGSFWGTTGSGGTSYAGTVFKVDASTGVITTVVDFANSTTGDNRGNFPVAGLVSDGAGNLWGTTETGGANSAGTVFEVNVGTGAIVTVVDFANTTTGNNRGGAPVAALVSDGVGNLWGTTQSGGANSQGTVFKVNVSTGAITTVVDFANTPTGVNRGGTPVAALVSDGAGNLWGTTQTGGLSNYGTVFEVNVSTGVVSTVVDFVNSSNTLIANRGAYPSAALVSDGAGNLWGTTSQGGGHAFGTVFAVNASTGAIGTVVDFAGTETGNNRGGYPNDALVSDGAGNLWGMTNYGGRLLQGTIFKVNTTTGLITTVANMGTNPITPAGLASDGAGNLWGTTSYGGASGGGTVFKLDGSGNMTTLVNFDPLSSGNNRGAYPAAALASDGAGTGGAAVNLWGTTSEWGANGTGTLFAVNASTGAITTLLDFGANSAADPGMVPAAAMVSDRAGAGGSAVNLWGTTTAGGLFGSPWGGGTVFTVNASTGVFTTVVDFANTTTGDNRGNFPSAALMNDGAGYFWGTTAAGGANSAGTVFKVNASTGVVNTVADFANATTGDNRGGSPTAALVSDGAGYLWGTTQGGGANAAGTVYNVNTSTGVISTVVDFDYFASGDNRGGSPEAALVNDGLGNLWGMTAGGGVNGLGTIFKINLSSGAITTYFDFTGYEGSVPGMTPSAEVSRGPLLLTPSGLYGVTAGGGDGGGGEIFAVAFGPQFGSSASSITSSGATISGSANPQGVATSVSVEYGTTTSYGSTTSSTSLGSGTSSVPFSIGLSSLSSGTAYHYRLAFVTANGTFYSADQTFTTN